ncbi:putative spermidine/putrescine transport system substrate-binding protein [Allocatelliglobosispora scoriae]|uniref:Putative spermidine/putrescine transport system substrate-binding protein n=1 Tax=Allocatelliglobosispora scoriae TaxID=643052 RepID=A0A841BM63_9ACTN|nr:ABC transporter substrate-binding protein [Allocatelliglobosispora scoriae]MBB5867951.1 putative spermidine/putrescine transport system substrate-binding protein [Allocatelliglobosispora scoriae]
MTSSLTRRAGRLAACITLSAVTALAASACGAKKEEAPTTTGVAAGKAVSVADFGGMEALVAAAKKEGQLNVITLPPDWANYGEIIKAFSDKYAIKVNSDNPDGSSADEIAAVKTLKGQDRAPDVLDLGVAFALSGAAEGLFAPYKVAAWDKIPAAQKDAQGRWFNDYGGYVSIGCDAKRIAVCPQTFADLTKPEYKGKVALNGNPTKSGSAIAAVYAASLANGGSFDDIQPGIDFFAKLHKSGNFIPVESTPATVEKGETPISLDWDYLNAGYAKEFAAKGVDWKVVVPTDGKYANYYSQAINLDAPHPAAARLWEEYLYSTEGHNLWLKGYARPVLLPAMIADGTASAEFVAALPKVEGEPKFPTPDQNNKAKATLVEKWAKALAG